MEGREGSSGGLFPNRVLSHRVPTQLRPPLNLTEDALGLEIAMATRLSEY